MKARMRGHGPMSPNGSRLYSRKLLCNSIKAFHNSYPIGLTCRKNHSTAQRNLKDYVQFTMSTLPEAISSGAQDIARATLRLCFISLPKVRKRQSYAASIGTDAIPENLAKQYSALLGRYQSISVREKSGKEIISRLTGKEAAVVLDPTLLFDRKRMVEHSFRSRGTQ